MTAVLAQLWAIPHFEQFIRTGLALGRGYPSNDAADCLRVLAHHARNICVGFIDARTAMKTPGPELPREQEMGSNSCNRLAITVGANVEKECPMALLWESLEPPFG